MHGHTEDDGMMFAKAASITRKLWEALGYRVHVQTNKRRIVIVKNRGDESNILVKGR